MTLRLLLVGTARYFTRAYANGSSDNSMIRKTSDISMTPEASDPFMTEASQGANAGKNANRNQPDHTVSLEICLGMEADGIAS